MKCFLCGKAGDDVVRCPVCLNDFCLGRKCFSDHTACDEPWEQEDEDPLEGVIDKGYNPPPKREFIGLCPFCERYNCACKWGQGL